LAKGHDRVKSKCNDVYNNYMTLNQENSAGLSTKDSNTPIKIKSAYKIARNKKLGKYLDRANMMIKSSVQTSVRSSYASSSRERSMCEVSYENNDVIAPFKRVALFLDNKNMSVQQDPRTYPLMRNSLVVPKTANMTRKEFRESGDQLKSFVTHKINSSSHGSSGKKQMKSFINHCRVRNSVNIPVSRMSELNYKNNDDGDLKDFVDVEDYCRRTTAANSRASVVLSTPKSDSRGGVLSKLQSAVKNKTLTATRNPKPKFGMRQSNFVKTFAITISKDDNIIFN
jgi:hypothetical protein